MSKKAAPLTAEQLRTIRSLPGNDACADSGASQPGWASVSFGTVISLESAGCHRGLGVHVSFVRSLTMDDFTEEQVSLGLAAVKLSRLYHLNGLQLSVRAHDQGGEREVEGVLRRH